MKRHGNLFKDIVTTENINLAYRKARKGKRWQRKVKDFERDLDNNIEAIRQSLLQRGIESQKVSSYLFPSVFSLGEVTKLLKPSAF